MTLHCRRHARGVELALRAPRMARSWRSSSTRRIRQAKLHRRQAERRRLADACQNLKLAANTAISSRMDSGGRYSLYSYDGLDHSGFKCQIFYLNHSAKIRRSESGRSDALEQSFSTQSAEHNRSPDGRRNPEADGSGGVPDRLLWGDSGRSRGVSASGGCAWPLLGMDREHRSGSLRGFRHLTPKRSENGCAATPQKLNLLEREPRAQTRRFAERRDCFFLPSEVGRDER